MAGLWRCNLQYRGHATVFAKLSYIFGRDGAEWRRKIYYLGVEPWLAFSSSSHGVGHGWLLFVSLCIALECRISAMVVRWR
jgi:hypothetical protein